jgi:hypothetical protein
LRSLGGTRRRVVDGRRARRSIERAGRDDGTGAERERVRERAERERVGERVRERGGRRGIRAGETATRGDESGARKESLRSGRLRPGARVDGAAVLSRTEPREGEGRWRALLSARGARGDETRRARRRKRERDGTRARGTRRRRLG